MTVEKLMTVGEFAEKVGVTVRTIQYYDQKGLLHPSKVSDSNQRLYTEEAERELRRILVLKYLGLSLSDIAEQDISSAKELADVVVKSQDKLSEELLKAFERSATLNKLATILDESAEVDWPFVAHTIEQVQSNIEHFWDELSGADIMENGSAGIMRDEVLAWHALMGETITAVQGGVMPADPRALELAERFEKLGGIERALQGLGRMASRNDKPHGGAVKGRDFYRTLQDSTLAFLQEALAVKNQ